MTVHVTDEIMNNLVRLFDQQKCSFVLFELSQIVRPANYLLMVGSMYTCVYELLASSLFTLLF